MKILLPVDGSPSSSRAVRYVIRHGSAAGSNPRASLVLLHVAIPVPYRATGFMTEEGRAQYYKDHANADLRSARRALRLAGVPFEELREIGDPAKTIIAHAAKLKCDLIAMGSHGRGAFMSAMLGSVVMKVLSRSKIPVLVVR